MAGKTKQDIINNESYEDTARRFGMGGFPGVQKGAKDYENPIVAGAKNLANQAQRNKKTFGEFGIEDRSQTPSTETPPYIKAIAPYIKKAVDFPARQVGGVAAAVGVVGQGLFGTEKGYSDMLKTYDSIYRGLGGAPQPIEQINKPSPVASPAADTVTTPKKQEKSQPTKETPTETPTQGGGVLSARDKLINEFEGGMAKNFPGFGSKIRKMDTLRNTDTPTIFQYKHTDPSGNVKTFTDAESLHAEENKFVDNKGVPLGKTEIIAHGVPSLSKEAFEDPEQKVINERMKYGAKNPSSPTAASVQDMIHKKRSDQSFVDIKQKELELETQKMKNEQDYKSPKSKTDFLKSVIGRPIYNDMGQVTGTISGKDANSMWDEYVKGEAPKPTGIPKFGTPEFNNQSTDILNEALASYKKVRTPEKASDIVQRLIKAGVTLDYLQKHSIVTGNPKFKKAILEAYKKETEPF